MRLVIISDTHGRRLRLEENISDAWSYLKLLSQRDRRFTYSAIFTEVPAFSKTATVGSLMPRTSNERYRPAEPVGILRVVDL